MKKFFFSLSLVCLIGYSLPAAAQIIIIEPGCDPYNPCQPPPAPRYVRPVAPRYSAPPVARPVAPAAIVPTAPAGLGQTSGIPFRHWSLGLFWSVGGDDESGMEGGGVYLQYMFGPHWGIEGSLEGLVASSVDSYEYRDIFRASLSALWYPTGLKMEGVSFYLKAGIVSQTVSRYSDGYDTVYNDQYYNDVYYDDTTSGSSLQFGGGLHWRMLDGFLSFGLEAMIVGAPDNGDEYDSTGSASFNLRFMSAVHF